MILDETGGNGRFLAGQAVIGLSGVVLLLLGLALFILWAKRHYPVEAPNAKPVHAS
ncbi:hypothetical protein [Microbacterium sp. SD291]|uniref:hypothetical protein n=1 Tax=Microbacterium sp. SD291 TaxID=2782007 RepID=UPI001A97A5DC|nr:hypothetical protein [Microbacterium sp. SD291]MBO0980773.1 hypothetical protein [Microbacterium sp. SD291]